MGCNNENKNKNIKKTKWVVKVTDKEFIKKILKERFCKVFINKAKNDYSKICITKVKILEEATGTKILDFNKGICEDCKTIDMLFERL